MNKSLKILGLIALIVSGAATVFQNWVDEKETEELIDKKIAEALNKPEETEEE